MAPPGIFIHFSCQLQQSPHTASICAAAITIPCQCTKTPPSLIVSLLEGLQVHCTRKCGKIVRMDSYIKHLKGQCRSHYVQLVNSPSKLTLREVLSTSIQSPATPAEMRVTEHLVRKICTEGVMKVQTRGQVCHLYSRETHTL